MPVPSRAEIRDPSGGFVADEIARGLYAIVDITSLETHGLDPLEFTRAILAAHPAMLQIRAKQVEARELLALLRAVGSLCRAAGVALVTNDRVDLAVLAGSPFVHVGQHDLAVDRVRRVAPGLRVGVSTHTLDQLDAALALSPDYVAYGPVFPTTSKSAPDPCVGLDGLAVAAAKANAAGVPLVAIGGVTLERAPSLASRATAAAVIHALLPTRDAARYEEVTDRARALHAALGGVRLDSPALRS